MCHNVGVDFLILCGPVRRHGFSLLVRRDRNCQIDQRHGVFDHLAVYGEFSICVPIVIGFHRHFIFQRKFLLDKKVFNILFNAEFIFSKKQIDSSLLR